MAEESTYDVMLRFWKMYQKKQKEKGKAPISDEEVRRKAKASSEEHERLEALARKNGEI